jgi:hypothetical protein
VFFNLPNKKVIRSRVASFVKVPYVNERIDVYKTDLNPYNKIYNTIYVVKKDEHRTYFYVKNNLIRYYNKSNIPVFTIDVISESYKISDLGNIPYINKDPESIVLVTEQGKQYLISNKVEDSDGVYVAVIDITTGKEIYIEPREDEIEDWREHEKEVLYFSFMRPLGNSIIPIIKIQREFIVVDLIDISDHETYYVSWAVSEIQAVLSEELLENNDEEDLPDTLISALRDEEMDYITTIEIYKIQYRYANYQNNINYAKGVSIYFMFQAYAGDYECEFHNVSLNITLDMKSRYIKVYLDFTDTNIAIGGYHVAKMKDYLHKKKLLHEKFNFSGVILSNNTSDILYSSKCYVMWHDKGGVKISKAGIDSDEFHGSSSTTGIYRHKDYLFMLRNGKNGNLSIANMKDDSIAVWSFDNERIKYIENIVTYNFHYLSISDVFVFISNISHYLLLIDRKSLDNILDRYRNCQEV